MYFGSGSVVAAANVLLVVALVVVALLVMPLIHDRAMRLIMRRSRGAAGWGARKTDIIAPQTDDQTLKARRGGAADQARAAGGVSRQDQGRPVLEHSEKLMSELDKRSILIDAQKTEIIALKIQVETLEARLKLASNDRHVQNLENRLVEQSRRLNENEFELKYLRDETEVAQKAEVDLRRAMIEIDGHAKRATQNHEAEKAKLQAALDRANGERGRLAYELAKIKQQAERTTPAEQGKDVVLRECTIDAESSGKREGAFLHQPLIVSDEVKRCLAGQSAE
jgi:hypothetical protein